MATIAVGDIHGNLSALNDVLDQLRRELLPVDTVVFLGDYIDRGPDSKRCVDAILRFRNEVGGEVVALMGNHEDWLLRTFHDHRRHSWLLGMEAFDTIRSYSAEAEHVLAKPRLAQPMRCTSKKRRCPTMCSSMPCRASISASSETCACITRPSTACARMAVSIHA